MKSTLFLSLLALSLTHTMTAFGASQIQLTADDREISGIARNCGNCINVDRNLVERIRKDPCVRAALGVSVKSEMEKAMNGGYDIPDSFDVSNVSISGDRNAFSVAMDARSSVLCVGELKSTGNQCLARLTSYCR